MAASYPTNILYPVDDRSQPINRLSPYGHGSNPSIESYPVDDHSYHQSLRALTIRRHRPGSDDPTLQKFPINLQPLSDNITSSSKLNVTIKRHSNTPEQPLIQPVVYPVPVYMNTSVPQYPLYVNSPIQLVQEFAKPSSPIKAIEPVKKSPSPPPVSPNRYQTEVFHKPTSRNRNNEPLNRRPVRTDIITPSPPVLKPERIRSSKVVVEEFDDYDEYYDVPSAYSVPKKVISYRTVPDMTTREIENYDMNNPRKPIYVKSPKTQTVTYRVS